MTGQLYLHIGDSKTGSTAIQSMLAAKHCVPQGIELYYPSLTANGPLARSLGDRPDLYPKRWNAIARRLKSRSWDIAVLSSELFEYIRPDAVARALQSHLPLYSDSVKVIVYVRPHISRLLSQFAENIKLGLETGNLEQFIERFLAVDRLQYDKRLQGWQAQFGDRLIVRPYLRDHLVGGDVRRDFLALILGDHPYRLTGGHDSNASLGLADLALMRMLQRRFEQAGDIPMDNRVVFGKQFGRLLRDLAPIKPPEPLRLTRPLYDRVHKECLADAQKMDADWLGTPCLVDALTDAGADLVETAQSLRASDYHSPETLRLMQVWGELILRQMADPPPDFTRRLRPKT